MIFPETIVFLDYTKKQLETNMIEKNKVLLTIQGKILNYLDIKLAKNI